MKLLPKALLAAVSLVCALASQPTLADDCTSQIAAMFVGGPLDAYQQPPHRHEKRVTDADGNIVITYQSIVETPLRTISGIKGGAMTIHGMAQDRMAHGHHQKITTPRTVNLGTMRCKRNRPKTFRRRNAPMVSR